eukprot:251401_1
MDNNTQSKLQSQKRIEKIAKYTQNIAFHMKVEETLVLFKALLQQIFGDRYRQQQHMDMGLITEPVELSLISQCNLFTKITNDMMFIKANNKPDNIKQHISFIKYLLNHYWYQTLNIIYTSDQLQNVFDAFVINSRNDHEKFLVLDLFKYLTLKTHNPNAREHFYTTYFKPLMLEYKKAHNLRMISHLYCCYHYCFRDSKASIEIWHGNVSESLPIDALKLNNPIFIKVIMDELYDTVTASIKAPEKYSHLIFTLYNIIKKDNTSRNHIALLDDNNLLTSKTIETLQHLFNTFASNLDGSLCMDDFRRYIIACGAGPNSAQPARIKSIFEEKNNFSFKSYCEFYRQATLDRPHHIWNDFNVFLYDHNMDLPLYYLCENQQQKDDEIICMSNVVSKYDNYQTILDGYVKLCVNKSELSDQTEGILHKLPRCYDRLKKMKRFDMLLGNDGVDMHQILREILNLDLICVADDNNKWKHQFLKNKLFDILMKTYCGFYCRQYKYWRICKNDQVYQIGLAKLVKIMYCFCAIHLPIHEYVTSNVFMHNALKAFREYKDIDIGQRLVNKISELKQHYLIGLIIFDAKLNVEQRLGILNVMPHSIAKIHSKYLILGYVKLTISVHIPHDIIELVSCFFL